MELHPDDRQFIANRTRSNLSRGTFYESNKPQKTKNNHIKISEGIVFVRAKR